MASSDVVGLFQTACDICKIDSKCPTKYRCPRCFSAMCSKECYSNHNDECTESFFKERVQSVLCLESKEAAARAKMTSNSDSIAKDTTKIDRKQEDKIAEEYETIAAKLADADFKISVLDPEELTRLRCALRDYRQSQGPTFKPWWEPCRIEANGVSGDSMRSSISEGSMPPNDPVHISMSIPENWTRFCVDSAGVGDALRALADTGATFANSSRPDSESLMHLPSSTFSSTSSSLPSFALLPQSSPLERPLSSSPSRISRPNTVLPPVSAAIGYHILGILLGYIITMRSADGDWTSDSSDFFDLFLQSTPTLDTKITPSRLSSVAEVVAALLEMKPPTLDCRRKYWTILLQDAINILSRPQESVVYALLDSWLLAASSQGYCTHDAAASNGSGRIFVLSTVIPLMQSYYCNIFAVRPQRETAGSGRLQRRKRRDVESERASRKLFFLLLQSSLVEVSTVIIPALRVECAQYLDLVHGIESPVVTNISNSQVHRSQQLR